jgi:hypothetical protein
VNLHDQKCDMDEYHTHVVWDRDGQIYRCRLYASTWKHGALDTDEVLLHWEQSFHAIVDTSQIFIDAPTGSTHIWPAFVKWLVKLNEAFLNGHLIGS